MSVAAPSAETLWRLASLGVALLMVGLTAYTTYRGIAHYARKERERERSVAAAALQEMSDEIKKNHWVLFGMHSQNGMIREVKDLRAAVTELEQMVGTVDGRFTGVDRDLKGIREGFDQRFGELRSRLKALQQQVGGGQDG